MIEQFHFLRPMFLLAIPGWLLLVFWLWRRRTQTGIWHRVCDPQLAPFMIEAGEGKPSKLSLMAIILAGTLALVALAGPTWRELPQPVFRNQSPLVVAVDLSASMNVADITPSRLSRARLKILDLLQRRQDGQTALVAYAGDAFTVTPLTDDTDTIAALLPSLKTSIMPVQGSRTERAVLLALDLLKQAGGAPGKVLLIADSVDGTEVANAVEQLRKFGHRLFILGIGTSQGAPIPLPGGQGFVKNIDGQVIFAKLDESAMGEIASLGGGFYLPYAIDDRDIDRVLALDNGFDLDAKTTELQSDQWREEGPWLVLLLLALVLPVFRKGLLA